MGLGRIELGAGLLLFGWIYACCDVFWTGGYFRGVGSLVDTLVGYGLYFVSAGLGCGYVGTVGAGGGV